MPKKAGPSKGKGPGGRPPAIEDPEQLQAFMRVHPTLEDCAAFFKCTTSCVEKYIKRTFGVSFSVFREQNTVWTRYELKRKCIQKALKGDNTMLIWTTKNLCGWKDKDDKKDEEESVKPFALAYDLKEPKE